MSDFKKGLLLGFVLMIACVSFVASNSNSDNGRYYLHPEVRHMLDTKTGTLYKRDKTDKTHWIEDRRVSQYSKEQNS